MSPAQQAVVVQLRADGFTLTLEAREIVRLTRGADRRVVLQDGTTKRGHHESKNLKGITQ